MAVGFVRGSSLLGLSVVAVGFDLGDRHEVVGGIRSQGVGRSIGGLCGSSGSGGSSASSVASGASLVRGGRRSSSIVGGRPVGLGQARSQ